nr:hypothetical protein [Tanacetum cinerariifolium]
FLVYQMDVKSAFLYGDIEEEVYVTQPKGFEDPHFLKHVYRVVKALYGLHQAPGACQDKYVKDILTKFDIESLRTATTPYEAAKSKLKDESDPLVNVHLYRSMIVKKIFKYLKGQPNLGLWYPQDSLFQLEAYSDSDYAGSHSDRKSTTGGCQFLVVILPAGCFVPAGSYGLCWWLRDPAGRHTLAGGFISTGGCVFLLFSWFLLIVDSFCWLDTFMLLALFMLSKHLFKMLNWFVLVVSCFCWFSERIMLIDFEPAGYKWELNSLRF